MKKSELIENLSLNFKLSKLESEMLIGYLESLNILKPTWTRTFIVRSEPSPGMKNRRMGTHDVVIDGWKPENM